MKTKELLELKAAFEAAAKCTDPKNEAKQFADFHMKVARNVKTITLATEDFADLQEAHNKLFTSEAGKAYEKARVDLAESFAEKDAEGKAVMKQDEKGNSRYDITAERMIMFSAALIELQKEHAAFFDNLKQSQERIEAELEAEHECEIRRFKSTQIPSDIGEHVLELIDYIEE